MCEREKERGRERACVCVRVYVCVCERESVCAFVFASGMTASVIAPSVPSDLREREREIASESVSVCV